MAVIAMMDGQLIFRISGNMSSLAKSSLWVIFYGPEQYGLNDEYSYHILQHSPALLISIWFFSLKYEARIDVKTHFPLMNIFIQD